MKNEWNTFQSDHEKAPDHLREALLIKVTSELRPSAPRVLAKLGILHVFASMATLSVCPQFGFRLAGEGMGAMHWFMNLGTWGCPIACGSLFVGTSLLLAAIILSRPEWRTIRANPVLTLSAVILPSLGFFKVMDGEFFLEFSIAWILGAVISGWLLVAGVWRLKAGRLTATA